MTPFVVLGIVLDAAGTALVVAGAVTNTPALLAPGIPLMVVGTVFWLMGARTGAIGGGTSLRAMLRGAAGIPGGLPARALVQAMGETGMTINEAPVFTFDLEVRREGEQPYAVTVKQLMPRMLVGAVLPGHEVAVRVHPTDPSQVGIDWSQAVLPVAGSAPQPGTLSAAVAAASPEEIATALRALPPEQRGNAADLLARGRRGTARILGARAMGTAGDLGAVSADDPRAGDQILLLDLQVKLPGRGPYLASVLHRVPSHLLGKVGPGLEVTVAVDRADPEHDVAVDWDTPA